MIDLHAHVLPGVDDGPKTIEESLAILRDATADGTRAIVATPHVRSDYPTAPQTMERLVAELGAAAHQASISIEVLPGGELDLLFLRGLDDATLARFGLGATRGFFSWSSRIAAGPSTSRRRSSGSRCAASAQCLPIRRGTPKCRRRRSG